jgi:hypothetical protein
MRLFWTKTDSTAILITIVIMIFSSLLGAQQLRVSGPSSPARQEEVLELPLAEVRANVTDLETKIAENAQTHERLPTQILKHPAGLGNDLFLIAVRLPSSGRLTIDFVPNRNNIPTEPEVFGREAPERKDDFAWENKFVAYRVYGPALEATGEITSGIDVWSKRVPNFVINSFYKHDAEGVRTHNPALSYHKDDGVGLDSYYVGPTRGCGGTGVIGNGKLWVSKNYTHLKQISDGPVRFEFELTYAPWNVNGLEVTETKHIELDAGTHLNKISSTFTFGGSSTIDAATGLAIHPGASFTSLEDGKILSVWDTPQDPSAGRIATGIIEAPNQAASVTQIDSQGLLVFPIHSGQTFTFYAGSGWSKADMPNEQAWEAYLKEKLFELNHPLQTQWVKNQTRP